ncbi:MAG: cell division protein SepF [Coriobacteriales bacterium]|jgi:cell division inhibitor SepF|nr:cell division protein SepF [Coriobacteriales bacterium]
MGIWDNLKSRMGIGNKADSYDDDFDEYGEYDAYREAYGDVYIDDSNDQYYDDRAAYDDQVVYDDSSSSAPLVNMADIRSRPVGLSRGAGSREDRIPPPVVRERRLATVSGLADEDSEAFRDSLARSPQNSLVQLHSERIQMEANVIPEFNVPESRSRRPSSITGSNGESRYSANARSNAGTVTRRGPRQVEHLRPQSYADAEEISICLRKGSAVVVDLTDVRPELAKRILDFSFGVTSAFEGQVDRFADRVYILTRNGALTEAERRQIRL